MKTQRLQGPRMPARKKADPSFHPQLSLECLLLAKGPHPKGCLLLPPYCLNSDPETIWYHWFLSHQLTIHLHTAWLAYKDYGSGQPWSTSEARAANPREGWRRRGRQTHPFFSGRKHQSVPCSLCPFGLFYTRPPCLPGFLNSMFSHCQS